MRFSVLAVRELPRLGLTAGFCIQGLLLQSKLNVLGVVPVQCELRCCRQEAGFGYLGCEGQRVHLGSHPIPRSSGLRRVAELPEGSAPAAAAPCMARIDSAGQGHL